MRQGLIGLAILLLCSATLAREAQPGFTSKPTVSRVGEKVRIKFSVDRPTDVAVFIEDGHGKVVRHLVAGVLGDNPPAPLEKNSLSQSLVWDGKDDAGRAVPGGKYSIRIGFGLRTTFDKLVVETPRKVMGGKSLAVGPSGEVFVLDTVPNLVYGATTVCQVFDRAGKYLRTIMPYPANLPKKKVEGFGILELSDTEWVPLIQNGANRCIYPALSAPRHQSVVTDDGKLLVLTIDNRTNANKAIAEANYVFAVCTLDGSCPRSGPLGPMLHEKSYTNYAALALSPDNKTLYAAGFGRGPQENSFPLVYRCSLTDRKARLFITEELTDPVGLATDSKGNLYVAEHAANRIAVFNPEGKLLRTIGINRPNQLAIHRDTGAIYTLTGERGTVLTKLSKAGEVLARLELELKYRAGRRERRFWPLLALDDGVEPALVWLGTACNSNYPRVLLRVEDNGKDFSKPLEITQKEKAFSQFQDISVDRDREELYVRETSSSFFRIDGRTGAITQLPKQNRIGTLMAFGRDGNVYVHTWDPFPKVALWRLDREFQPIPFSGRRTHRLASGGNVADTGTEQLLQDIRFGSVHTGMARGVAVTRNGDIYMLNEEKRPHGANSVHLFGADGNVKKAHLVKYLSGESSSLRVDAEGNVYLASAASPVAEVLPPFLQGKVSAGKLTGDGHLNWYPVLYGSILKFGPAGGAQEESSAPDAIEVVQNYGNKSYLRGALWQWHSLSPVPSHGNYSAGAYHCICAQPRFDVDDFGRVFAPDVGRFAIHVLDTNANPILRVGSYGNQDSRGEIKWAWPSLLVVSDEAIYVCDVTNRRIVRVKLGYQTEAECEVKW